MQNAQLSGPPHIIVEGNSSTHRPASGPLPLPLSGNQPVAPRNRNAVPTVSPTVHKLFLLTSLLLPCALSTQTLATPATTPAPVSPQTAIHQALTGRWTGVLEYRDYSEPPTSLKRVQLPTWLTITPTESGLSEHFIYDDGPTKTVQDTQTVTFDLAAATYTESEPNKPAQAYKVTGFDKLTAGRGDLILTGPSTDNDKPAETRITLSLRRNLLTWIEEVRPANSTDPFAFRHRFTFTRAEPPPANH